MWRVVGRRKYLCWNIQKFLWTRTIPHLLLVTLFLLELYVPKISAQNTPSTNSDRLPQIFDIQPHDRTAVVGKTAVLPCRVLNKVGTLQWTRDGFGLGSDRDLKGFPRYNMIGSDEEGDFTLQITKVTLEDDAQFQCQVGAQDGVKGIRSRSAAFTVYVPPEAPKIVQGNFLRTTAGMTVELTCESHGGKPAAELTWLGVDGNVVSDGVEYTRQLLSDGKTFNAALKWTLTPGREHDSKTFSCKSENPALTQPLMNHITLEVKYPPEITLKVSADKISEFDDVKFTCDAVANPGDVIYKWYRNDEVISGDQTTAYTIKRVTRDYNKDTISCEVSNSVGTTKSTHTLNVLYKPVFKERKSEAIEAVPLAQITLSCDVDGNPTPDTVWTFEGSNSILSTDSEYTIGQLTRDKAGKYTCRATAPGFAEITTSIYVYIKGPPHVKSPAVQYGVVGEDVKIVCTIASVPAPSNVMWSRDARTLVIDNSDGYQFSSEDIPGGVKRILEIKHADEDDFGQYNCTVWNELGHDSMQILLKKQKSLPMLIILAGVIGGIVFIVSVTIVIILCLRRKSVIKDEEYGSEKKAGKNSDSASSGDSDLKVEIRTASSLSNNDHERSWEDNSDTLRVNHDGPHLYNKYGPIHHDCYSDSVFPPKPEAQSNNGYIPYVDYTHEYNPPILSQVNGIRDNGMYNSPPQSLTDLGHSVDPRYRAGYANPYLRTSTSTLPPPQGVFVTSTWGGPQSPTSPTPAGQQPSGQHSNQTRFITAQQSQSHVKPGTLATHV